jgi:hypothetical protein
MSDFTQACVSSEIYSCSTAFGPEHTKTRGLGCQLQRTAVGQALVRSKISYQGIISTRLRKIEPT